MTVAAGTASRGILDTALMSSALLFDSGTFHIDREKVEFLLLDHISSSLLDPKYCVGSEREPKLLGCLFSDSSSKVSSFTGLR